MSLIAAIFALAAMFRQQCGAIIPELTLQYETEGCSSRFGLILCTRMNTEITNMRLGYFTMPSHYDDAGWVSARLVELLPLQLSEKQWFLEVEDPLERLAELAASL